MRNALLALLAKGPAHGYELKRVLDDDFGEVWGTLNIGQIYTTLGRLERDGLVRSETVAQDSRPAKKVFALTADGHSAVGAWINETLPAPRLRDEFFTKVVLADRGALGDPLELIDRQRRSYLRELRALQALGETAHTTAAELAVEGAVLHLQADLKWLETCEQTFARKRMAGRG
jgi:DNA-binding PadR family transcriptional regulator